MVAVLPVASVVSALIDFAVANETNNDQRCECGWMSAWVCRRFDV